MTEKPIYVLERIFDAPRDLVWKAWTDPALLPNWYGPRVDTTIHQLDLEPGGLWLLEMNWGGQSHFQRAEYTEVTPPERLVWLHSSADAAWNIIASPMMPDWPKTLLTTVTFEETPGEETDAKTLVRLTWVPFEASAAEIACFAAAIDGMGKGWESGMALLADLLSELQSTAAAS